jgi:ATP-dependent helicase/nuclease subunit A
MSLPSKLTAQQQAALAAKGVSVALGAGAGCGKTSVLSARFLGFLELGGEHALSNVAGLTFTEKAARELRERVRRSCRENLLIGQDVAHWRAVHRGLQAAPISTFHGFCGELLRRFPLEAGVEPDFHILDETVAASVRDESLSSQVRAWLAEPNEDFIHLAVEFGLETVRDALAALVSLRGQGSFSSFAAQEPKTVVLKWRDAWEKQVRPRILGDFVTAAQRALDLLSAHDCNHPEMGRRKAFLVEALGALAGHVDPAALLAQVADHARVQGGGTAKHWPSPQIYDQVKSALSDLRQAARSSRLSFECDEAATFAAAELGLRFARLALGAAAAYEQAKRDRGALDFDDLLIKTRDLLQSGPASVRSGLRTELHALLVDEFQDTDPIQAEILELLAGDELSAGRLFLVGDFKQSIYRFRGAQPGLFHQFRERFPQAGRLSLQDNFRSTSRLIDFFNAFFDGAFPGKGHTLRVGGSGHPHSGEPAVEFLWASDPSPGAKEPVFERRRTEARWIAHVLASRLAGGWKVRDMTTEELRTAEPGDVTLLFRTLKDAAPYEQALADRGLDYHVVGGSAFFAQQEVLDLINLLSVLEDPFDELALAGALRSPFFCVSDNGLYWLATARGDIVRGFEEWRQLDALSPTDRSRVGRAHDCLTQWRARKDREPIATLVDRVLVESGYEAALSGEFLGARKRANARKLVRMARPYDVQGGFTLGDFVARLRADWNKPPREEQAATNDEEAPAIRLMTIHQAKGLEFPIVIVPDLNRRDSGTRSRVAYHRDLGIVVNPAELISSDGETPEAAEEESTTCGLNMGWSVYRALERAADQDEALRLFYVAVTRARDHLILSAGMAPDEPAKSPALRLLDQRFDRATGACRATLPEDWTAPRVNVIAELPASPSTKAARRSARPPLRAIARSIRSAESTRGDALGPRVRVPRLIDLTPARTLLPYAAQVDRLVRSLLADPRVFDQDAIEERAAHAGRLLNPMAPPGVVALAAGRVRDWLKLPLARAIASAQEVKRSLSWTVAWPPEGQAVTVIQGQADFVYRNTNGDWRILNLSDPEAAETAERLRLLLSSRAIIPLGIGPVVQGSKVTLGSDGASQAEDVFDDEAIDRALTEYLESLA